MNSSVLPAGPHARAVAAPKLHLALVSTLVRALACWSLAWRMTVLTAVAGASIASATISPDSVGFVFVKSVTFGSGVPICPGEPVIMTVQGTVPNCMRFAGMQLLPTAGPLPVVAARFVDFSCVADCLPGSTEFTGTIDLGPALHGLNHLWLYEQKSACPDTSQLTGSRIGQLEYVVRSECPPPPPSLDSLVRSFTFLRVVPERPCAGDTVRVELVKPGCPPCVHLSGFGFTRVRGLVASVDWAPLCAEFRCAAETLSVSLGSLRAGFYHFEVATDVHVLGTDRPESTISFPRALEFAVAGRCDTLSQGCLDGALPPFGLPLPQCSALIRPGASGDAVLPIRTTVPAAGIEGFLASVAPFRVTHVAFAGTTPGVQVSWRRDGALTRFVLFGTHGVAVPAGVSSLLRVTLAADSSLTAGPEFGRLQGVVTLASDAAGDEIPLCAQPAIVPPALTICLDRSALSGCDVNGDGHTDVRDLVRMAMCLRLPASADPRCHDCDHDGTFGVPDLICCAREVLGGGGVPGDSAVVQAGLVVSIDPPVAQGNGFRLKVHVRGAGALGAALLRVRYPAERWRVTTPEVFADYFAAGWMPLIDQGGAGILRLGALRLSEQAQDELVYELDAVPIAAASEGDALVIEGADLTSPSGAVFAPSAALPRAELSPVPLSAIVELSPARPNPFGRATSFSVSLPREATVELTVHDVTGRTVARLAQGRMSAGRRSFTWDASAARDGMFFVRLVVDGHVRTTRVALLRNGH